MERENVEKYLKENLKGVRVETKRIINLQYKMFLLNIIGKICHITRLIIYNTKCFY